MPRTVELLSHVRDLGHSCVCNQASQNVAVETRSFGDEPRIRQIQCIIPHQLAQKQVSVAKRERG